MNHHKTPANKPSLAVFCFGSSKIFLSLLTSFLMTEHWLKQPKILPCYIAVKWQTMKMYQPTQNSCKASSLTSTGMSLDQVNSTYPCLAAFITT